MKALDGDGGLLRDSAHRTAKRDIVQFVPLSKYSSVSFTHMNARVFRKRQCIRGVTHCNTTLLCLFLLQRIVDVGSAGLPASQVLVYESLSKVSDRGTPVQTYATEQAAGTNMLV